MQSARMILCLGPHRTGTSAVAAALAALGAETGIAWADASAEGARGSFEHPGLVALNERLLAALGGAWDSAVFRGGPAIAAAGSGLDPLRAEALDLLRRSFRPGQTALLMDPRLCLLLDFWLPVIAEAGFSRIDMVHVLRDPLAAALSHRRRSRRRPEGGDFGAELPEGAALWLSCMGQMWDGFDRGRHLVVSFDALLGQPGATLRRLAGFAGLPVDEARIAAASAGVLDPALTGPPPAPLDRAAVEQALPQAPGAFAALMPLAAKGALSRADVAAVCGLALAAGPAIERIQSAALARLPASRRAPAAAAARPAPQRAAGRLARAAWAGIGAGWIRVNHLVRWAHQGVSARAPRCAERLRRLLWPALAAANLAILGTRHVPAPRTTIAPKPGQTIHPFDYQAPMPGGPYRPLVSVIVPNYNHAPFLRQRLDSIYGQSWPRFEVILLDDGSGDDSRAILQDYAARHADRTRVILNDKNSGSAFRQWEKGMAAARGDLIWIAESDDWCSANFLETLVPFFANPAVQLAYAPSVFMNGAGDRQIWSMAEYLSDLGPERWDKAFVIPAPRIVREAFAERNIIPNVSSALMRRIERPEALEADVWRGMRTCGDWVFYLNLMRGGLLAYSPDAQNFYRMHGANTSALSHTTDSYYIEHETVARCVQRHYSVDPLVFQRQRQALIRHWTRKRPRFVSAEFDACYSLPRIMAEARLRKPRLMMAGFAFCSGGGETFPITLANLMKSAGYDVTYLNCRQAPEVPGIRGLLARDIPVVTNFEDLNGILRDFEIEVIHSHHAWTDNTILDLMPESSPVKTVITLHGMYETLTDDQLRQTLPRLDRRTGAMVHVAEKNISAWTRLGRPIPRQMRQIDNALADGPVTPVARAALGIGPGAFVLVVVSRAIAPKGWQEAIEAVTLARRTLKRDLHLVLVGDGPECERLRGKTPPFVHLEGFRSNPRDYFAMADAGLLPTRFPCESFPLAVIDCLMTGRPMIATHIGEIRRMLTGENGPAGELFDLVDGRIPVDVLAGIIVRLAADPQALGRLTAEVASAARQFDPVRMRDGYDHVYHFATGRVAGLLAAE
ncbi:MAG: glycosyltransferase [Paracoccaceae bacterium]